ncbi:MAG: hypothetical protein GY862_12385 [Gammaproteobacteria bacterium]|nr:hypothetical protein [Gammaproteobacteria bacterium]
MTNDKPRRSRFAPRDNTPFDSAASNSSTVLKGCYLLLFFTPPEQVCPES